MQLELVQQLESYLVIVLGADQCRIVMSVVGTATVTSIVSSIMTAVKTYRFQFFWVPVVTVVTHSLCHSCLLYTSDAADE